LPKGKPHAKLPGEIRIIGGLYKRTRLAVPDRPGLRPTPDRVRETLFNWLGQDLTGWRCADVFAGTGVLGFEAASIGIRRPNQATAGCRPAGFRSPVTFGTTRRIRTTSRDQGHRTGKSPPSHDLAKEVAHCPCGLKDGAAPSRGRRCGVAHVVAEPVHHNHSTQPQATRGPATPHIIRR
ncbi:MAG: RsmD family RNA methyltransferase, partial [Terracoccus sp.]